MKPSDEVVGLLQAIDQYKKYDREAVKVHPTPREADLYMAMKVTLRYIHPCEKS